MKISEQIIEVAEEVKKSGAQILRGGAFKPRTSPYAFQGLKDEGLRLLIEAKKAGGKLDFKIDDTETAKSLFGSDIYVSATKIEDYGKCPFLFFCRYGLNANPRERATLDARMGGNVVHHVLEKVLSEYKNREFLQLSEEEIEERIRYHLNDYLHLYILVPLLIYVYIFHLADP